MAEPRVLSALAAIRTGGKDCAAVLLTLLALPLAPGPAAAEGTQLAPPPPIDPTLGLPPVAEVALGAPNADALAIRAALQGLADQAQLFDPQAARASPICWPRSRLMVISRWTPGRCRHRRRPDRRTGCHPPEPAADPDDAFAKLW